MYLFWMLVALVVSLIAQVRVKTAYNKWSEVSNQRGITGAQAARSILDANGLQHIQIARIGGTLTDNYNPKTNVVSLSDGVYNSTSVAAIGIAAHEVGHAIQHSRNYIPIKLRSAIVPVANFGGSISWWLIIGGLLLNNYLSSPSGQGNLGYSIAILGVILYASVTAFHLVTLPVELNASNRAKRQLKEIMSPDTKERRGVKIVLRAAAMTYVAALFTSIVNLLRVVAMVSGSRRRN